MEKSNIGLIGLAVMGQNLARNISRSHKISVYNRTTSVTDDFIAKYGSDTLQGFNSLESFVESIESPRKIGVMVQAGRPVDAVIDGLLPLLDAGDTIIDFGNSNFNDTVRREKDLSAKNIHFFGCGVSGGEEGALNGPSLMPGGDKETFNMLSSIFENIAAKDFTGGSCVTYIGENGAGHFVKMVHNGIEYGVMEMMAEAYEILSRGYSLTPPQIADIFEKYNAGKLRSFLFEISVPILRRKDPQGDGYLIDKIYDAAGQKGTGTWTAIESLNVGAGLSVITEAVFARSVSSEKEQRIKTSKLYQKTQPAFDTPLEDFIPQLENALLAGMIVSYAQGFVMFEKAAVERQWDLNFAEITRVWQGGCIIRADLLSTLQNAFLNSDTRQLLEIPAIVEQLSDALDDFRKVVAMGVANGIPLFSLGGALSSFEAMTNENNAANFIQAQRDCFGAHTFKRVDVEGVYHADWSSDDALERKD